MATVMIIDDHPAFVAAAHKLLAEDGFDVVGEAFDGRSGVALADVIHPDIVLLDIQLPDIDGFEVARQLADLHPGLHVVLTSTRDAVDYGAKVDAAPARGFIGKADLTGARLAALVAEG